MKSKEFHASRARSALPLPRGQGALRVLIGLGAFSGAAWGAPCPTNLPNPIYGSGGSAVTPTLGAVATALRKLPASEAVTIFYWDPGACAGYEAFVKQGQQGTAKPAYFRYWTPEGVREQCEPSGEEVIAFAHMGNTPLLCPGSEPLPAGFGRFVAPVQTINVITHWNSTQRSISAEAFYHVYGFGPGAPGRSVAPWTVVENVFARSPNSFVHQILANATGVPAGSFKLPPGSPAQGGNFVATNDETILQVLDKGGANPNSTLGYVSGSNADASDGPPAPPVAGQAPQGIRTLAFQDFGQTCAYLPHSSETKKDNRNARSGQYALWTPAWFYAATNAQGSVTNPLAEKLIRWFDGSAEAPGGISVPEIVIDSGDIPLCAMQAIRPDGDLSPIASYAPENPCNGFYEFVKLGQTDYVACEDSSECNEAQGERCRFGFCEAY